MTGLRLCRVCGWDLGENGWEAFNACPNYIICDCCGNESGVHDVNHKMIAAARRSWERGGFTWFVPENEPSGWSPDAQLEHARTLWRA